MSNDLDTDKNPTPASGGAEQPKDQEQSARELAGKAMGQAKEGVESFKKLEPHHQIYLVGLVVAFLFSVIFTVMTVQVKVEGPGSELFKGMTHSSADTAFDCGWNGKMAVLAALAGIGIWIWNRMAAKKEAWVPLALAGCAGLSALLFFILMLRAGGGSASAGGGVVEVDIDMTLLGFWVPFAGAIAATVVSVKRLLKPAVVA